MHNRIASVSHPIHVRRLKLGLINKEKTYHQVNFPVLADHREKIKES